MTACVVTVNCPTFEVADRIAEACVAARLAASANRHAPITSRYHWQGEVVTADEVPLVLKTRPDLAATLAEEIRRLHPYDTPAILWSEAATTRDTAAWLQAETGQGAPYLSAIPVLRAEDYPRARAFYEKLGFSVVEEGGDPPRFGIFRIGPAQIFVDAWHGADPARQAGWRAYFHVADIDATAKRFQTDGISLKRGPETMPYGLREIDIEDPDGNCLCFGQILPS